MSATTDLAVTAAKAFLVGYYRDLGPLAPANGSREVQDAILILSEYIRESKLSEVMEENARLAADFANACDVGRRQEARANASEARVKELEEALKPFALDPSNGQGDMEVICRDGIRREVRSHYFRRARSLLSPPTLSTGEPDQ